MDFKIREGHTYSFQELMKKMIPMDRMAGFTMGTTMVRRILVWLAFSSFATSTRDLGIPLMCWRSKKIPVASASCGRATPRILSLRPILEMVMKLGIMVTVKGIKMVLTRMKYMKFFPLYSKNTKL